MGDIHIISASAGSGKTYRLTELLQEKIVAGKVRASAVLATTFTNKAAAELQERVRVKLLSAGLSQEAQELMAARIGTVNSVCGRIVSEFAFELGLSPDLRVIDEEPALLAISQAISRVLRPDESAQLEDIAERMDAFDWRDTVHRILSLARANALSAAELDSCAKQSWSEFEPLIGKGKASAEALDKALLQSLQQFVKYPARVQDKTKKTQQALDRAVRALMLLRRGIALSWREWAGLAKLSAAKASEPAAEVVRDAAAQHDVHPRLRGDVSTAIALCFAVASRAMDAYQNYKRELGVLDFVDQECYALELLGKKHVREQLAPQLDLVLVDEFQDTSPIQLAIFLRLAEAAKQSVWVGDQKQAIYGFRGADPMLMDMAIEALLGDEDPETLKKSYRSRPELVELTSAVFAASFQQQGIPAKRVQLKPAEDVEPKGLGPIIERWSLQANNCSEDAAAVACGAKQLLDEGTIQVRDRHTKQCRSVRPGDLAVLCKTNAQSLAVAEALSSLGIRAVLPRQGLFSTLEGRAALAALRYWVDAYDTLAAAELARLIDFASSEDEWLLALLKKPGRDAFADSPLLNRIVTAKEAHAMQGALGVFDRAMEAVGLGELCRRWGDAEARLANLEAMRAHAVTYVHNCQTEGSGCTPAGLVAYFAQLQAEACDAQGVDEDENAVVVSTWHAAKGMEWPLVTLFPLSRRDASQAALGVSVQSEVKKLDTKNPLKGRYLRFWPNPYAAANNSTPFHQRLGQHPATARAALQAEKEELRLLYVGWTRARDRLILAERDDHFAQGLLSLLCDKSGPFIDLPQTNKVTWAGRSVSLVQRSCDPLPPVLRKQRVGKVFVYPEPKQYPTAFLQPSAMPGANISVGEFQSIGKPMTLKGTPDWASLGSAIHGFLASDRPGRAEYNRLICAQRLLESWGVAGHVSAPELLNASDALRDWVAKEYGSCDWCREWPTLLRESAGSVLRGTSDLVIRTNGGLILIDHKSFPGTPSQAIKQVGNYIGQLTAYQAVLESATGEKVKSVWVHLPVSAGVVRVSNLEGIVPTCCV